MRIAWEASALLPPRTGVGHCAMVLLGAMRSVAGDAAAFHLVWRSARRDLGAADRAALAGAHFHTGRFPPGPMLMKLWDRLGWPRIERFTGPVDLVHGPAAFLPPSHARASVLTIHDLHFLRHPEHAHPLGGRLLARHLPRAVRGVTRVIVPSEATACDVIALLGVERERIEVVPHGGAEVFSAPPTPAMWDRFHAAFPALPDRFLLTVATIEPRKNIGALIEALEQIADRGRDIPPLVLLGEMGWGQRHLAARIEALRVRGRLIPVGHQDLEMLRCFLRRAAALVFPSLAEGFGLPLLEAMASGCPVLCSDIPVFREVSGGHVQFFDPGNSEAIADAVQGLSDTPPADEIITLAREHTASFTWERAARRVWEIYQAALSA